jgi:TatD DNase family protein
MHIYDSHCHLDDNAYSDDISGVLERMRRNDVAAAMIAGINHERVTRAISLAERFPELVAAVGVHPHDAAGCREAHLRAFTAAAAHPKVRAWGEIGLDFNRMYSPREVQEQVFVRQLDLAHEARLPIIIHERDTEGRLIALLKTHHRPGMGGVVHCFSGTRAEMDTYLDMGFHIGITGIITHKKRGETLRRLAPQIPAERILVETDAPYLTPAPERNKHRRNEPAFVRTVLVKVADVRGDRLDTLAPVIWENTCTLFGGQPG